MNNEGIKKFLAVAEVGMDISISTIEQNEKYSYHGVIMEISPDSIVIQHESIIGLQTEVVKYKNFYWHSLEGRNK